MTLQNIVFMCLVLIGSTYVSVGNTGSPSVDSISGGDGINGSSEGNIVVYMNRADYRELRLEHIRREILQRLGWREPPKINSQSVANVRQVLANEYNNLLHANQLSEERRCFSTSCNLQRNINTTLWNDDDSMGWRLYTGGTTRLKNAVRNVITAQLKLFLRIPEGFRCTNATYDESSPSSRFLVSVYQFIRPLRMRTHRTRRRLQNRKRMIDARMVGAHNHWVSLNVKTAVSDWLAERRHNYGFEIGVRDDNENECNASAMFVPVNCNSPVDIGCVEEDANTTPIFPWVQTNVDDNFPYLEVSHNVRRRASRDTSHAAKGANDGSVNAEHSEQNRCYGVKTNIEINEKWILIPRNYTSLICLGTCSSHQPHKDTNSCHPTSTKQLQGTYVNKNLRLKRGPLPYTQVLECGC